MITRWMTVIALAGLAGCAPNQPIPEGYTGPTATLFDSGEAESRSKARMFVVLEIDGLAISNSVAASTRASAGQGMNLATVYLQRAIPARPMKVKLMGTHKTAAPIHEMGSRMAGTFFSVEGVVEFSPEPDGKYIVKGELRKEGSSVWIEDVATRQPVTQIVRQ